MYILGPCGECIPGSLGTGVERIVRVVRMNIYLPQTWKYLSSFLQSIRHWVNFTHNSNLRISSIVLNISEKDNYKAVGAMNDSFFPRISLVQSFVSSINLV